MRKIILITLLMYAFSGWAQETSFQPLEYYKIKVTKAKKMRTNGIVFTATGAGSLILGSILASQVDYTGFFVGGTFILYGVIAVNIGVPFWIAGSIKAKNNQKVIDNYKPVLSLGITSNGIGLVLKL